MRRRTPFSRGKPSEARRTTALQVVQLIRGNVLSLPQPFFQESTPRYPQNQTVPAPRAEMLCSPTHLSLCWRRAGG